MVIRYNIAVMYITPHVLAGTAVGLAVGDPVLGFLGGMASHYILDAVPHTDSGTWHFYESFTSHRVDTRDFAAGIIDLSLAIFGFVWLAGSAPLVAPAPIWGALGGAAPDLLVLSSLFFPKTANWPILKTYYYYSEKFHYTAPPKLWFLGIVTQLLVVGGALWYLLAS
ncbi:hypothetical protein KC644_03880 [Candidatus Berkelbacteria bacterium]|nr:hypothetical protein [Candidatus Berkelbacteria bacterium]